MEPQLSDLGQIAITVSDVTVALAFYRDVLGLPFFYKECLVVARSVADQSRVCR